MDFNIFRKFFMGSNISQRDPMCEDCDQRNGREDIFYDDSFEGYNSHNEMFKQMEDVFNRMISSSFGVLGGFPNLGEVMPVEPTSPRSIMLKDSDENISSSSVEESEGSGLLPYSFGTEIYGNPHSFSYSKFSSVKTVHLSDGAIEEHRTVIDNDGKKTTKIQRIIGDTSHEVITKSDKEGLKEKEENFMNMDEKELPEFEKTWRNLKSNTDSQTGASSLSLPDSNPSYLYLLKKLFGS